MKQKTIVQIIGLATTTLLALPATAQTILPDEASPPMRPDPQYERGQNPLMNETGRREMSDRDRANQQGQLKTAISVSDLIGRDLVGQNNSKIGEIAEIYIDIESGEILGAVVSSGGVLGFGANKYLIHVSELRYDPAENSVKINRTSESLRTAPRYREGDTDAFGGLRERSRERGILDESRYMGSFE